MQVNFHSGQTAAALAAVLVAEGVAGSVDLHIVRPRASVGGEQNVRGLGVKTVEVEVRDESTFPNPGTVVHVR